MNTVNPLAEESPISLGDYFAILKRRRLVLLWTVAVILLVAVALAAGLPSTYQSTATILIEQQEIPQELVRSTVTTFADQRLQVIRQRVMTTSNLVGIIDKYGLYADDRDSTPIEQIVEQMTEDILMETVSADVVDPRTGKPTKATIAFTIAYSSESQDLAQRVANELTSLYLNENLKSRAAMTADTSEFLSEEAAKLETQISQLESKLAEFKRNNAESLPELAQLNLQLMDRTERELDETARQIRSLEERSIFLSAELAQLDPIAPALIRPTLITDRGERILEAKDRLKVLQSQLLSVSSKYAEGHPDLIRLRREMAALEADTGVSNQQEFLTSKVDSLRAELVTTKERYSPSHPDVKRLARQLKLAQDELSAANETLTSRTRAPLNSGNRENPAYVQIRAQLEAARSELKSFKTKSVDLRQKLESFEGRLAAMPEVERSFRGMSRDYENAVAKYQEINAKRMEAQLAQSLESEQKGERFTLIEPALFPEEPASPNRLAIFVLGLVLSTAGGFGGVALSEALDNTVYGRRGLTTVFGVAPLAVIPHISTPGEIGGRYLKRTLVVVSGLAILGAIALAIHLYHTPLDVAWFAAMRKFGL
jgi:succinoglycan biosynthesis transport protein ExoP